MQLLLSRNVPAYVCSCHIAVTDRLVLVQSKGVANPGPQVSGLELGGLAGSLSAGALSDLLMRKNTGPNPKGNVGLRVQVDQPPGAS